MELISYLDHPHAWWRETAQRLLVERQDRSADEGLQKLIAKSRTPLGQIHALWTLFGLGGLTETDLMIALNHASPRVREQGVKLSEKFLPYSKSLFEKVSQLAVDDDARVRFQVALSLGEAGPKAVPALAKVAFKDADDPWIRAAVLSCHPDACVGLTKSLLQNHNFVTNKAGQNLLRQLTFVLGAQNKTQNLNEILNAYSFVPYCHCDIEENFLGGLGDGFRQAGKNFRTAFPNSDSLGARKMNSVLSDALERAMNQTEPVAKRAGAIRLLSHDDFGNVKDALGKLLDALEPQEIQLAAVRSLAGMKHKDVGAILLQPWRSFTPQMREETLTAIFSRADRLKELLDAMESGNVSSAQISQTRRTSLLSHATPAIRGQATKLFGGEAVGSRKDVLEKYKAALSLNGNAARGQKVYENNCMVCHRSGGKGNEVGPNLETVRAWDAEKVMMNILDPNREVAPDFVSYEIELKDGASLSGIIVSETAGSMSLKRADGVDETVLRQNIEKISSSGMSLMPEGLETAIPPKEMADLVAFLLGK